MIAFLVAGVLSMNCWAGEERLSLVSPDGHNEIRLALEKGGLAYEVLRDGVRVVGKSALGMTVDGRKLTESVGKDGMRVTYGKLEGREETPVYKKGSIDLSARTALADFGDWGVALIARNDGVAYRFELRRPGQVRIDGEEAEVTLPAEAEAWMKFTNAFGMEEHVVRPLEAKEVVTSPYKPGASKQAGDAMIYLPILYTAGGKTVAVTESDVRDYPIWNLTRVDKAAKDVVLESLFAPFPKATRRLGGNSTRNPSVVERGGRWIRVSEWEEFLVQTPGTRTFPWRTFILADSPAQLCEADIVYALATPADPKADFAWVKPGKVAWEWWNCFDNQGGKGCNTKTYERFIDFAAKTGVEYVIMDEGWSQTLNIWQFNPKVDVPHLIRYANERGVGIILWMAWAQIFGEEERVVTHFAQLGAKGFKVDFMDRGDAEVAGFLEKFAAACAKAKMVVDYHGAYRPTGMQRMFPNILNYEGISGLEQMKWYNGKNDIIANDVRDFYLRLTAGPMDYTPGAMLNHPLGGKYRGAKDRNRPGSLGTRCRQMAMIALYEAPLQMLCDSPTNYEKNMECFTFMASTPVVWKNTVALGGSPETLAGCAREAKDGSWYACAIANATAQTFTLDTAFLGAGDWQAEIFRDAEDASTEPTHFVHERKRIRAGEKMPLALAPGGGFIVRFSK